MGEPARKQPERATYEDLLSVPDHLVAEILDGELIVSPRPSPPHARASARMGADIMGPFDDDPGGPERPGGWWILDEPELHLGGEIAVPDLAGWRRERMPEFPETPYFPLAPDWVCEVLSPSTEAVDRVKKMPLYARVGVKHLWLVNPLSKTLEVYQLEGPRWLLVSAHHGSVRVRAVPFDAVEFDMSRWWLSPASRPAG